MLPGGRPGNRQEDKEVSATELLDNYLDQCPLVAIVRGVTPGEAEAGGEAV